jgi:alpha-ketoglutarate-dependent 2,4-dichlorophenoxyacetate dioxygenase
MARSAAGTLHLEPLHPLFAAEASGIDISPPARRRAGTRDRGRHGPLRRARVPQPAARPGPADRVCAVVRAARPGAAQDQGGPHRFKYNELADISNVKADGEIAGRDHAKIVNNLANQLWHSDSSFQRPRAKYSMLSAVVVPSDGGETEYADLRAAHDALPPARQHELAKLTAKHYALHSRMLLGDTGYTDAQRDGIPPAYWPLIQTDPRSGRKALYVGVHACEITGMTVPERRMLLLDLLEHATQREFVYRHHWQVGDLVMWDNTCTLHRGRHFDLGQRRELRRATTAEVALSPEAAALA